MSTILILLSTVHVGVSLQQLLEAFIYVPADVPDYSAGTTYWFNGDNTLSVIKYNIHENLVCNTSVLVCQSYAEGNKRGSSKTLL